MKILYLKKQFKHLYLPSAKKIEAIQIPSLQFAMIDGAASLRLAGLTPKLVALP